MKNEIYTAYSSGDDTQLVLTLLKQKPFPVKDPYVAFLRKHSLAVQNNPQTVSRIASRVRKLGIEKIIESISAEKEANRQIGPLFKRWLYALEFEICDECKFENSHSIAILEGSESALKAYVERRFGVKLKKNPDFVAKARNTFVLGEAKLIADYGGHQSTQFQDAMLIAKGRLSEALGVAVLDGVVWIKNNSKMFKEIRDLGGIAISALLLKKFLENLAK